MKFARAFARSLVAAVLLMGAAAVARATTITGATLQTRGNIVELDFGLRGGKPRWRIDGVRQQLTITLDHTQLRIAMRPLAGREPSPLMLVNAMASGSGDARIVIDVTGQIDYAVTCDERQLIVRVARAGTAPDLAAPIVVHTERVRTVPHRVTALRAVPTETARPSQELIRPSSPLVQNQLPTPEPRAPDARTLVVIDPGHGGRDPGTRSASGLAEKDLALQIATRLDTALRGLGIDAILTRTDDRFLSLAERTALANRDKADLFVSIHLNSSPNSDTAGIETYYLNNTTDRATIRLARMENGAGGAYGDSAQPNLNYILVDLRQGDKANESASLARMIETETVGTIGSMLGIRTNALGAKKGPFYVLVGATMPSILIECGFLSNRTEAATLANPRYQAALADGIAAAVVHYFNNDAAVGNL